MKNTKTNNSIFFLTTLGVYLGLVLVGAAAGVFAQASDLSRMTREQKCSLSAEIGNEARGRFFKLGYHGGFISFLPTAIEDKFEKEAFQSFYEITVKTAFSEAKEPVYSVSANPKWRPGDYASPDIAELIGSVVEVARNSSIRKAAEGDLPIYIPVTVRVESSKYGFAANLHFSESSLERAKSFAAAFSYMIEEGRCNYAGRADLVELFVENTGISNSGDQISVVTRVSRAELESIFARKIR